MVEMQSARLKRAGAARHLLEARDFSVRLHIIESVKERIVCTCVLLECRLSDPGESENDKIKREHLHRWYIDCGFSVLQTDGNLVQYFKII